MTYKKITRNHFKILTSKLSFFILLVFLMIIVYSIIKESKQQKIIRNEISSLQVEIKELENKNLKLVHNLKYYQSPNFIEREARNRLNMAKTGEHAVLVSRNINNSLTTAKNKKTLKNWQLWIKYFLKVKN